MKIGRFAKPFGYSLAGALVLISASTLRAATHDDHTQTPSAHHRDSMPDQKKKASALVTIVRESTGRFQDPAIAEAEGYALQFGCVSGSDAGAMGLHFVNFPLVLDGELDVTRPEIVLYEPLPNGKVRMTGADYLVLAEAWNATHPDPPQLMGQLFHLFESPNRFGLPPLYTLHVWAWKENPNGSFVNWNPSVSCDDFADESR
jgi:hypothetical protein